MPFEGLQQLDGNDIPCVYEQLMQLVLLGVLSILPSCFMAETPSHCTIEWTFMTSHHSLTWV